MRIGVNTLFLIPGEVGGTETYLRETLRALIRIGDDTDYVLFTNRENHATFTDLFGSHDRVRLRRLNFNACNRASRVLREQCELPLRACKERIDLLWSPGYTAPFFCSCKQVVTIHDMQYKRFPEDLSLSYRLATDFLVKGAARRCDRIMADSEFGKQEIVRHTGAAPELVTVVNAGVDCGRFGPGADELGRTPAQILGFGGPFVLCVADSYPHKNLHALVSAFGELADGIPHRLVIVGRQRRGEPLVKEAASRLPERHRLIRLEGVSAGDLAVLYRGADLFVFPSLYEGFGLPVLEAMAAGTPVVTARRGAIPEIAGDCVCYFDEKWRDDLAVKIREVLGRSAQMRESFARRARKKAGYFSWGKTAEKTLACFRSALAGEQSGAGRQVGFDLACEKPGEQVHVGEGGGNDS